jgi:site-specific DNA-cytosine methylase
MLRSLDLFTGIAGITHALRGLAEPVAYCECEPRRIATLEALQKKGCIPKAPIHNDILTLDPAKYKDIDIVCGGWPCMGWSAIGKHEGFNHAQSALFFEFTRIVNGISPPFIFQENVPAVLAEAPMSQIPAALPNYDLVWMTLPAYSVGAQHTRLRWYCLGIRKDIRDWTLQIPPYARHTFTEAHPRLIPHRHPHVRLSMLGNSVVPDAVRLSFLMLFAGFTLSADDLWAATTLKLTRPTSTGKALGKDPTSRRYGSYITGTFERHSLPEGTIPPRPDLGLSLVPFIYKTDAVPKAPAKNILHVPRHGALWATPRGANLGASGVLTERTVRDLYTQLRFEKSTPEEDRNGYPNPHWVENLMGFPADWTLF